MGKPEEASTADDHLAAFVDRILRMKAEEDAIKSDIKEIYAEAHAMGFDKTRLGETVTKARKMDKDASGELEKEAVRDLYWTAYCRAKKLPHAHAYARGVVDDPEHDPETGEIIQPETANEAGDELVTPLLDAADHGQVEADAETHLTGGQNVATTSAPIVTGEGAHNASVTTFTPKPLRPYCLNPGNKCGGQGKKHCFKCEQANAEQGAA